MPECNVLLTETAFQAGRDLFGELDDRARFLTAGPEGLPTDAAGLPVHVAWISNDLFDGGQGARWFAPLFLASPDLCWVHSSTAGLDTPLFAKLVVAGVRVTSAHIYGEPISEYVLRAALEHAQQPARWREAQEAHEWRPGESGELTGATWVIVGVGDIGSSIASRARAFGVTTIGVARSKAAAASVDRLVTPDQLLAELPAADVVVLARPGGSDEPPLVDATFLAAMKEGSLLINVARGSLVDEQVLLLGLDEGRPARAVLDVFAEEPLPANHPFWDHPGVVVTPHISGQGRGRHGRGAAAFAANLRRFLDGEPLAHEATA